jgi:hypothetical protein
MITFEDPNTFPNNDATLVHAILSGFTYNVTHLYNPVAGAIAAALIAEDYDQVWVFDAVNFLQIDQGGAEAIAAWYHANAEGNIIIDSRATGVFFTPDDERPLIENFAHAFSLRCGGLWLGSDHGSEFANNANAILDAISYPQIGSSQGASFASTPVPNHEILNLPNVIDLSQVYIRNTPGRLETGLQDDGTDLKLLFEPGFQTGARPATTFALEAECSPLDSDADGLPDNGPGASCESGQTQGCDDNCPFEPNNGFVNPQLDSDGNGRGDVCECGNVNADVALDIFDALMIAQGTLSPPIVELTHPRACDADGNGACDIFDALAVALASLSPPQSTIVQSCDAATTAPPPEPD